MPLNGRRPALVWLTGLSGSGKSTLARALHRELTKRRVPCAVLDGDELRRGLCRDLGFSPEDRRENVRRVGEAAKLLMSAGVVVVAALISPYERDRRRVRRSVRRGRFIEVYLDCSLKICERRDVKGLYRRARSGRIAAFTGVRAPYEPPKRPEVTVETGRLSVKAAVERVLRRVLPAVGAAA